MCWILLSECSELAEREASNHCIRFHACTIVYFEMLFLKIILKSSLVIKFALISYTFSQVDNHRSII
jgi:hypothetical protein